jgi:hypothetical protein
VSAARIPPRAQRELLQSRRPLRPCEYCGKPATFGFAVVPEPTERSTYAETWRDLCDACHETYRRAPYGFKVEL